MRRVVGRGIHMKAGLLLLALAVVKGNAATVLFSDLGTGANVYDGSDGSQISGSGSGNWITQGRAFTVSGSGVFALSQIDLGVVNYSPAPATFTASLWTNSSSQPSVELGSWNLSTTQEIDTCCALVTESGITGITLMGGVEYWIVLGPQSSSDSSRNAWANDSTGVNGDRLGSLNGGSTWIDDGTGTDAAFDVLGSAVPEPSSVLLAGTGLLAAIIARRRLKGARRPQA